jgi:hypothetical protein
LTAVLPIVNASFHGDGALDCSSGILKEPKSYIDISHYQRYIGGQVQNDTISPVVATTLSFFGVFDQETYAYAFGERYVHSLY